MQLLDVETGQPLARAHAFNKSMGRVWTSDSEGWVTVEVNPLRNNEIEFSYLGYKSLTIKVQAKDVLAFKSSKKVLLELDVFRTSAAVIDGKPDTVYGSKEYHVADFIFFKQGLLLLTYGNEAHFRKEAEQSMTIYDNCKLVWLSDWRGLLAELDVSDKASGFCGNHLGLPILETRRGKFVISESEGALVSEKISDLDFKEFVEPVVDTMNNVVYASTYNPDFPAFEYYSFDQRDSSYKTLRYIVDQPLMEMFRSEYKYLAPRAKLEAFRHELKTGIDKEIVGAYMTGFAHSMYYDPLYAPMFICTDSVLIFDHYSDQMLVYNSMNELIDSTQIQYHRQKKSGWTQTLIQDDVLGSIHSVHENNGYYRLQEINKSDGTTLSSFRLTHRWPEHIQTHDGFAYYVYRPFSSSQKKFLYKERID
ncbi:MAG: hypothetical protein ACI9RU_000164 [Litorivivens sp.]